MHTKIPLYDHKTSTYPENLYMCRLDEMKLLLDYVLAWEEWGGVRFLFTMGMARLSGQDVRAPDIGAITCLRLTLC